MKSRDWTAAVGAGLMLVAAIFVWAANERAFATPDDDAGWIYHYQGLIAGLLALAGAGWTVLHLRRDQKAQSTRFDQQMDALARRDRLLVSRRTTEMVSKLDSVIDGLDSARGDLNEVDDPDVERFLMSLRNITSEALSASKSAPPDLIELLDEDYLLAVSAVSDGVNDTVRFAKRLVALEEDARLERLDKKRMHQLLDELLTAIDDQVEVLQALRRRFGLEALFRF